MSIVMKNAVFRDWAAALGRRQRSIEKTVLLKAMAKLSSCVNPIPTSNLPFLGKQGTA